MLQGFDSICKVVQIGFKNIDATVRCVLNNEK